VNEPLNCTCGAPLPRDDDGGYAEGGTYTCSACLTVWDLVYVGEGGAVLVQREAADA
jgi:hypothetical protein